MAVKEPPYDQDEDLKLTLTVYDKDDAQTDATTLDVRIVRPRSKSVDALAIGDAEHLATGAYRFTYRVPEEWGIYHGTVSTDLPDDDQVVQQFDFSVQKPQEGP